MIHDTSPTRDMRACPTLAPQAHAGSDGLFVRLARRVYEASATQQLRFQGVFVNGGVDEVRAGLLGLVVNGGGAATWGEPLGVQPLMQAAGCASQCARLACGGAPAPHIAASTCVPSLYLPHSPGRDALLCGQPVPLAPLHDFLVLLQLLPRT